jgi:predicted transcriptional regulator
MRRTVATLTIRLDDELDATLTCRLMRAHKRTKSSLVREARRTARFEVSRSIDQAPQRPRDASATRCAPQPRAEAICRSHFSQASASAVIIW